MGKPKEYCKFDSPDGCQALVCYSSLKCNSRDKNGYPKYIDFYKEE